MLKDLTLGLEDKSGVQFLKVAYYHQLDLYQAKLDHNPDIHPREIFSAFATLQMWGVVFDEPVPDKYAKLFVCCQKGIDALYAAYEFSQSTDVRVSIDLVQQHLQTAASWGAFLTVQALVEKLQSSFLVEERILLWAETYEHCLAHDLKSENLLQKKILNDLDVLMSFEGYQNACISSISVQEENIQDHGGLSAELKNRLQCVYAAVIEQYESIDKAQFEAKAKELEIPFVLPEPLVTDAELRVSEQCKRLMHLLECYQQVEKIVTACVSKIHSNGSHETSVPTNTASTHSTQSSVTRIVNQVYREYLKVKNAPLCSTNLATLPAVPPVTFSTADGGQQVMSAEAAMRAENYETSVVRADVSLS